MGDIVLYDNTAISYERVCVPAKDVRYWLRFWRRQGRIALTLNQWKRQGCRPFRPVRKHRHDLAHALRATESGHRIL